MTSAVLEKVDTLPLHSRTPLSWGHFVLSEPLALLTDHAFLEKKAANNAMDMLTRWPDEWVPGWIETMTAVARDEAAHLAQVTRILLRRGGRLGRSHTNPYATGLRRMVRKGQLGDTIDRLFVSALIEARSCERFAVLSEAAAATEDEELAAFYRALYASELGHYTVFINLARKIAPAEEVEKRWQELLAAEANLLAEQLPGPRMHSGVPPTE